MPRKQSKLKTASVKIRYSFIKILTGSDLSRRRLPFMSAVSPNPGPVVWLTACIHGDEVCGIVIIQEVFKQIQRRLTCGTIQAFPLMNPIGFETGSRNITMSREDLNRSFPGEANGSLGERIAHRIFTTIMETAPTLVLDLHTDWKQSIPYTVIDRNPGHPHKTAYDQTQLFAKQVGFVTIVETEHVRNSFSSNLIVNGVPALTLELGEPYVINEKNVEFGLSAIWNILACLEMIAPLKTSFRYPVSEAYASGLPLRYSDKPFSSKSGIIRFLAEPGDEILRDQPIAKIVNAFGKHQETVHALEQAIVLGHSDSSVVFPGMPIMAFGLHA